MKRPLGMVVTPDHAEMADIRVRLGKLSQPSASVGCAFRFMSGPDYQERVGSPFCRAPCLLGRVPQVPGPQPFHRRSVQKPGVPENAFA